MTDTTDEREATLRRWIAAGGDPARYAREDGVACTSAPDEVADRVRARLLHPDDAGFPAMVRRRLEPAFPWFVRGALAGDVRVAVVGTRDVDHEGQRVCRALARGLAEAGVTIVSGGARGVDTVAHEAALAAGAPTIAVLPAGLDEPTPPRNAGLFERVVAEGGALVTEYPPGVPARRHHFQRRNRLIAALADAVVIVRARDSGGTMLTARAALQMGVLLFAVPGSPEDRTADGCNRLLKSDARCATDAQDVLAALGLDGSRPADAAGHFPLSDAARTLLTLLGGPVRSTDELSRSTGAPIAHVLVALTELEIWGLVERTGAGWRGRS